MRLLPTGVVRSKVVSSGPKQGESLFGLAYAAALAATKAQFARLEVVIGA
ncbi:MAG: hypothetical protein ACRDJU_07850 [Actinomycetota bacterium]